MAAAVVRVVAQEDVPRSPVVFVKIRQSGTDNKLGHKRQMRCAHRAPRQAPVGIHDTGVALIGLVDNGGRRRPGKIGRRLEANRFHPTADNTGGHRVNRGIRGQWVAFCSELPVKFKGHGVHPLQVK